MRYPFLFRKNTEDGPMWYVKIAKCFDYVTYNSSWMDCSVLGDECLVPDVDLCSSIHAFYEERDALAFIKEWWAKEQV